MHNFKLLIVIFCQSEKENLWNHHVYKLMKKNVIPIRVELGLGEGEATILASDLTHAYVSINGDYRS